MTNMTLFLTALDHTVKAINAFNEDDSDFNAAQVRETRDLLNRVLHQTGVDDSTLRNDATIRSIACEVIDMASALL